MEVHIFLLLMNPVAADARKNFLKERTCWISASRKPMRHLEQHQGFLDCCFHTTLSLKYMALKVLLSQDMYCKDSWGF